MGVELHVGHRGDADARDDEQQRTLDLTVGRHLVRGRVRVGVGVRGWGRGRGKGGRHVIEERIDRECDGHHDELGHLARVGVGVGAAVGLGVGVRAKAGA